MNAFLKSTIIGGILFLLPLAIVLKSLDYALGVVAKLAKPISDQLGLQQWGDLVGVGVVTILSALLLVLIAFAGGMAARTYLGKRVARWFESSLLGRLPQYQMVKGMAEGLAQLENASGIKPALISIEGGWQIGYLIESLENGWLSVFVPQAPTPMSGNIMFFPSDRVRPLDITMVEAMAIVKRIGIGSVRLFKALTSSSQRANDRA